MRLGFFSLLWGFCFILFSHSAKTDELRYSEFTEKDRNELQRYIEETFSNSISKKEISVDFKDLEAQVANFVKTRCQAQHIKECEDILVSEFKPGIIKLFSKWITEAGSYYAENIVLSKTLGGCDRSRAVLEYYSKNYSLDYSRTRLVIVKASAPLREKRFMDNGTKVDNPAAFYYVRKSFSGDHFDGWIKANVPPRFLKFPNQDFKTAEQISFTFKVFGYKILLNAAFDKVISRKKPGEAGEEFIFMREDVYPLPAITLEPLLVHELWHEYEWSQETRPHFESREEVEKRLESSEEIRQAFNRFKQEKKFDKVVAKISQKLLEKYTTAKQADIEKIVLGYLFESFKEKYTHKFLYFGQKQEERAYLEQVKYFRFRFPNFNLRDVIPSPETILREFDPKPFFNERGDLQFTAPDAPFEYYYFQKLSEKAQ